MQQRKIIFKMNLPKLVSLRRLTVLNLPPSVWVPWFMAYPIDIEGAKIDCLSLFMPWFMCPLLVQLIIGFFFLLQPFTVLMKKTRAVKQSIIFRCLWLNLRWQRRVQKLTEENLKVVWAKFSTLRWTVLLLSEKCMLCAHALT